MDIKDAYAHAFHKGVPTYLSVDEAYEEWWNETAKMRDKPKINRKYVLPIKHCLQGAPTSGKHWMHYIDNILINELGFTTTTHDRCVYHKVIDGEPIYLLRQIDDFMIATRNEQLVKDISHSIGVKVSFDSEKEQGIVPMEYLGIIDDYNGVSIRQTRFYNEMNCENYIKRLLRSHGWEIPSKQFDDPSIDPDLSSPTKAAISCLNALEAAYDKKMSNE